MKKKMIALLLCMTMAAAFTTGCGNGKGDTEATESARETGSGLESAKITVDASKQVTMLGNYEGMDISITGDYSVTDEAVENQAMSVLNSYGLSSKEVTDRDTVQAGDYVNVDYTGYLDGKAFDNGAAKDVLIDVDNNKDVKSGTTYIDGFSAGLIGAKKGDTVSSNVTFPENYQSSDLAGKETTFEFKINGIYTPVTLDTLSDDAIKEQFSESYQLNTVQEFKDYIRSYLEHQANSKKQSAIVSEIRKQLLASSEVEVPDEYLNARVDDTIAIVGKQYETDTQDFESYLSSQGTSVDEQKEQFKSTLEDQVKEELIFLTIADKQNIEVDEDGFKQFVDNYVSTSQYGSDADAVYSCFGNGDKKDGKSYLENAYRINKAVSYVVEKANVTENASEDAAEETTEAE